MYVLSLRTCTPSVAMSEWEVEMQPSSQSGYGITANFAHPEIENRLDTATKGTRGVNSWT